MKTSKRTMTAAAAATALLALAVAAPGAFARGSVATASETAPLTSSQSQHATARCPGGMHVTGGGFEVSPSYNPAGSAGIKANVQISRPAGKKKWEATAGAAQIPILAGKFSAYARCERNSLGSMAARRSPGGPVAPKASQSQSLTCPSSAHILFGGFGTDHPFAVPDLASSQLVIVRSQRTSSRQWVVTGYNPSDTVPATMAAYFYCEKNAGSSKVSSRSVTVPLADDQRVEASPGCPKRQHAVSGGFSIDPLPTPGIVFPSAFIDVSKPAGKGWKVGAYENPGFVLPAASTLTASAYCKKN